MASRSFFRGPDSQVPQLRELEEEEEEERSTQGLICCRFPLGWCDSAYFDSAYFTPGLLPAGHRQGLP